jgi:CheY-like chemotaxis protein
MKAKLLIVDDSVTILKIVAMAFENEDMVVQGASNGKDALEKLKDFHPDIVIADVDMPGIDGFELSRKIREIELFKSTPILLLTSDFEEFNDTLFKRSLANDHLAKPFKSEKIVEKVRQLVSLELTDNTPDSDEANKSEEESEVINLGAEIPSESTKFDQVEANKIPDEASLPVYYGEDHPPGKSSEDILGELEQKTEKLSSFVDTEEKPLGPIIESSESISSTTIRKPEDMTIEELLASAEALLEKNYIESDSSEELPTSIENLSVSSKLDHSSKAIEPILEDEQVKHDKAFEQAPVSQDETSIEGEGSTSLVLEQEPKSTLNQNETFEDSLKTNEIELSEITIIESGSMIFEEPNLPNETIEETDKKEMDDFDDSFLRSPINKAIDNLESEDFFPDKEKTPTEVHIKDINLEPSFPPPIDKEQPLELHAPSRPIAEIEKDENESALTLSSPNISEITSDSQDANEDEDPSQQTIDELDSIFENIQNFEEHISDIIKTETASLISDSSSQNQPLESQPVLIEEVEEEIEIPAIESQQEETITTQTDESDSIFEKELSNPKPSFASDFSEYHISPEPDNLLEKLAPSAFDPPGSDGRPDLIQETLAYLSELTPEPSKTKPKEELKPTPKEKKDFHMNSEPMGDMFVKVVGEHIKRILERSLEETIAKEISGLSKTIERSVKEVVKEVTPEITRSIIQEEIEKIRKLEEV